MYRVDTVSTANVPLRRKVQFWNDAVSAAVASATAEPLDPHSFRGELRLLDLGGIRFVEITGDAVHVRRPPCTRRGPFVLQQVVSGEILSQSAGRQTRLMTGDFWLFGPSPGAEVLLSRPYSLLALRVEREKLTRYIACPEAACSLVVSSAAGPGALLARYLHDFWRSADHELAPELLPRFADIALLMIASTYAGVPEARPDRFCRATEQRMRIRSYIEEHLNEADLTPRSVAEALNITPGYVHRLFSDGAESVARYILRRRLEECHRDLCDPMLSTRSVTAIAFAHGFNSVPHFCRAFRSHFRVTPGELRQRVAGAVQSAR